MTPTTPRNCPSKDIEKVTSGGTKLPEGPPPIEKGEREPPPPPMPPVPPLPWGSYEVYNEAGVKWLGPHPTPLESMHDGGDLQDFWNTRRSGIQQVPDPEAERVQRLEQELKDLREALTTRQVQGQDPLGACGAQPFQRMGPPTANPGTTSGTSTRHVRKSTSGTGSMSMLVNPIFSSNEETRRLGIYAGVVIYVQVGYLHHSRGVLPLLVYFMMIGIEKKNSSR